MQHLMIKHILSGEVAEGESVTIKGWVRTRRDSKAGISFLQVYDGSCFANLQAVIPDSLANYQDEVLHLTAGCAVAVTGIVVESQGKGQSFEIQASGIEVIGWVDDPDTYPISPKHHSLEYLREVAHLRPRTNTIGAVTRVRHTLAQSLHRFFDEQGFYYINTPIVTSNDCEGAGELFRVSTLDLMNVPMTDNKQVDFSQDFFGKESFLTVSGQLSVECFCLALSKVYTFGPTFRAENSNTARHLAEFWMVEPEVAFADLMDMTHLSEAMLKYVCKDLLEKRVDDMEFFQKRIDDTCISRIEHLIESNFETMEYTDAIEILTKAKKSFEFPVSWGIDLHTEHERYLAEEYVGRPTIIINYPKDIKAFYMRVNDDDKTVAAMDLLVPGVGELIGGSQREERLDKLDARFDEVGLPKEDYQWYRDLRRYGSVPHAGYGLGFERLVSYLTGVANVRDVVAYPRTPGAIQY